MNRNQNSILTRGKRILLVLIKFAIIVNGILKLKNLQTSLDGHVTEADKYKDDQIKSIKGFATKKHNYKADGTTQAVIIAGLLYELAVDTGDEVLAKQMKLVKTSFEIKDELALSIMKNVLAEATKHKVALLDYGFTDPQLAEYKANVDGFEEELNGPDAARGHKHYDTTELEKELIAIDANIASIEKIIENQAKAQPELYIEFVSANNNGIIGRHKKRNPKIPFGTFIIVLKDKNTGNIIVGGIVMIVGETEVYLTSLVGTPIMEAALGAQKIMATAIYYKSTSQDIIVSEVEQTIVILMEQDV